MPVQRFESDPVDVSPLAQPLKFEFSGRTAKNRFFKAAMAEDLATWHPTKLEERGIPTRELVELYRRWGEGGWGIITTGNMDIEFDMLDAVGDMIVTPECPPEGPRFEAFKELATAAKAHGSLFLAQVTHPGRQLSARIRKDTISASALQIPATPGSVVSSYAKPRAATEEDIARIIDGFSHAAWYLQKAGFDGIELHGAHGYLLSQFLSERTNLRTDAYGGTLENRIRLVVDIAAAIRRRTAPGFILGIKINSVEFQEKGMQPQEVKTMCEALQAATVDFVELSGGNHEELGYGGALRESSRKREAYFLDFVRDIVPNLTLTKKFLVGGFRTAGAMVSALQPSSSSPDSGKNNANSALDGISLARPAAQEPRLPLQILTNQTLAAIRPPQDVIAGIMLGISVSGAHMLQIGRGREPFDASDEDAMEVFRTVLAAHTDRLVADGDKLEVHGFPDLAATKLSERPYGDAY